MQIEIVLSIVGAFGTMALSVNAYFLRGIFQDLNEVKVAMATITANSKSKDQRIQKCEDHIEELFKKLHELEKQV